MSLHSALRTTFASASTNLTSRALRWNHHGGGRAGAQLTGVSLTAHVRVRAGEGENGRKSHQPKRLNTLLQHLADSLQLQPTPKPRTEKEEVAGSCRIQNAPKCGCGLADMDLMARFRADATRHQLICACKAADQCKGETAPVVQISG